MKMLHQWYLEMHRSHDGRKYPMGRGIVTGHPEISDTTFIHTSEVKDIRRDGDEIILSTLNSEYHCPLAFCCFEKMKDNKELLPDYEALRAEYEGKGQPTIEPGNVLLVISDFCEYYFHSLYYVPADSKDGKPIEVHANAHVGTFQDSFLIRAHEYGIDLRYFPHPGNIEFYSQETNDRALWIENIGNSELYAKTCYGVIHLGPGERKKVDEDAIESESPSLLDGDLYPAVIIDKDVHLSSEKIARRVDEEIEKMSMEAFGDDKKNQNND